MTPRILLECVDSTMAEAARRAPATVEPTWIVAKRQTAAKGRRGRAWSGAEGNFFGTLLLPVELRLAALHSFVAALALHDAFTEKGVEGLALKWPNDVLLDGGKVAGILLEMLPGERLAVGFGVNLTTAPEAAEVEPHAVRPVCVGSHISPEELLDHLDPAFMRWSRRLREVGFAPLRDAWLARAARLGETIRARTVTEEHHGTFETVDIDGCLVLSTAQGRIRIPAADVYF